MEKTDIDVKKDLYANVCLTGGSTLHAGFNQRVALCAATPPKPAPAALAARHDTVAFTPCQPLPLRSTGREAPVASATMRGVCGGICRGHAAASGGCRSELKRRGLCCRELNRVCPQGLKVKVHMPRGPVVQHHSAWVGGSILASLGSFHQMWVSKEQYREYGPALVHRMCS